MKYKDYIFERVQMKELDALLPLYEEARSFMRKSGNKDQWNIGPDGQVKGPNRDRLKEDIQTGQLWSIKKNGLYLAVFALITSGDPNYQDIQGAWLNDQPYVVIHRSISTGLEARMMDLMTDFALSQANNVRIDTHKDNRPMIQALARNGYVYCGVIRLEDGDLRNAYQISKSGKDHT